MFISLVSAVPVSDVLNSFCSVSLKSDVDDASFRVKNSTDNASKSLSFSECVFDEGHEEEINDALFFGTGAPKCAITSESDNTVNEKQFLPLHKPFFSECNLLHRRSSNVINAAARHKPLLENISVASPNSLRPLAQPEALLFLAIFWSHKPNGTKDGADPTALFNSAIINSNLVSLVVKESCERG